MTDAERLEFIKENAMFGIGLRTVAKQDFEWLIEQVGRAQELELNFKSLQHEWVSVVNENRSLCEGLEDLRRSIHAELSPLLSEATRSYISEKIDRALGQSK